MLAKKTPTVNGCKVQQCFPQHSVTSINSYEVCDPSPINGITNYSHISQAESQRFRCFETTLAICLTCDLPPDQAVQEDVYGQNIQPIDCDWWRSPLWRGAEK